MADILDVQMFTTQLQKELADSVTPELKKVTDISKDLNKAIIEGNIDVAVETIGSDKVKDIATSMRASDQYFEKIKETSIDLRKEFDGVVDKNYALNKISGLTTQTNLRLGEILKDRNRMEDEILPKLQAKVHQAELELSMMNIKDANYKSQQDKIKGLQDSLEKGNNQLAGMIGQEQGLLYYKDEQLKKMKEQIDAGKSVTAVVSEQSAESQKLINNSIRQLSVNQDLQKTLEGMNDAQKKLLKDNEHLIKETISGFDSIRDSITGAFEKVPLVGGMLKAYVQGPLDKATESAKKAFVKSFLDAKEAAHNSQSAVAGLGAGLKSFASGLAGMGKAVLSLLLNPVFLVIGAFGIFIMLIKSAFDELSRLETASKDFRLELGLSASEASRLREEAEQLEDTYSMLGLRVDDFYRANTALLEVFTSTGHVTKSQTETIALMEKAYGVQASTTAGAMNNLMKLGATGRGEAEGMVMEMKQLAGKHGVQFAKVMEDVANAGEDAMLFARGSAKALASGAVHARRMGSSIEDVASAASKLLDFESSINAEMEASTMFGRHINMSTLRRAAMLGNEKMMLQERHRIMDSLGGLENMNRFRQEKLAEAMGTTVGELQNMVKVREQEKILIQARNRGEKWATDELAKREEMAKKSKKTVEEQLKAEILKNREMEKVNAMTDTLAGLWLQVKKALLPIVNELMGDLVKFMNEFVGETGNAEQQSDKLKGMVGKVRDVVETVWEVVKGIGSAIMWVVQNWEIALGVLIAYKATMMTISALTTAIATAAASGGGGGGGKGGGIFGSIAKAINSIKPTTMLAAAAAMFIIAGAMWVLAEALVKMNEVEWKAVGIMAVGLLLLVGAVAVLGKIMMSGVGAVAILAGAAALLILGAALIPFAYAMQLAAPAIEKFGEFIVNFAGVMVTALKAIIDGIIRFAEIVGGTIVRVFQTIGSIIESVGKAIAEVYTAVFDGFASIITSVGNAISGVITSVGDAIIGVVTAIGDAISGIIDSIAGGISSVIESIAGAITSVTDDIIRLSEIDSKNMEKAADAVYEMGKAIASMGAGKAVDGLGNFMGAIGNTGAELVSLGQADTRTPFEQILEFANRASEFELLSTSLSGIVESFNQFAGIEEILEPAGDAIARFSDKISGMASLTKGPGVLDSAGNMVSSAFNKISEKMGGGKSEDMAKSPLQKIIDFANQAKSIVGVSAGLDLLLKSFDKMSNMETVLTRAANALKVFGDALITFGAGAARATGGGLSSLLGGLFGQEQKSPVEEVIDLLTRLSAIDVNLDNLDAINNFNISGFLGGITEEFEDKIEIAGDGLSELFNAFGKVKPASVGSLERAGTGISRLFESLAQSLPKVKVADTKNLGKIAESLEDFFEAIQEINISKVASLPTVALGIKELSVGMADVSNIPLESGEILDAVGTGIDDLFYELADSDLSMMKALPAITASIKPFISEIAILPISKIPKNVDYLLSELGTGVHDFFDNLAGMNPEALKYNTHFEQIVGNMVNLAGMPEVDFTSKFTSLTNIADKLNPENVDKLKAFTEGVASAIDKFANIQDPAVQALTAISRELYMLCDVIEKLDLDKLNKLENINIGGVQTEIKIPARKLDPADPFMDGDVVEGQMKPKLMIADTPDLTESLVVESKPIELNKRQKEREVTFRRQYETVEQLTDRIKHDKDALADLKEMAIASNNLKNYEYGEKLVLEDIAVLEKIRAEFMAEQSAVDATTPSTEETAIATMVAPTTSVEVTTPSTEEFKNTPLASVFTSPPPIEPTIEAQETAIATVVAPTPSVEVSAPSTEEFKNTPLTSVFTSPPPIEPTIEAQETAIATVVAPTPSVEAITESQDTDLANFFTGPIDVKVINADELSKPTTNTNTIDNSAYTKFKTELIESMGDRSLEGYESEIKSYIETNKELIKMGAENSRTGLDLNKFSMENKFMDKLLQEIEQEKSFEAENAKMIKESQIQGELMSLQDLKNNLSSPDGMHLQSNDYAKISSTLGINATGMERDLFINDKTGKVDHQFFKNEVLKMIHERESELINYDIVDSTSTIPTVPKLEIPADQTKQPEFILDTVPEAPSISGVDSMVQAISGTTRSVVDFGKNLLSDFFGKEPEIEDSTTNIELSGLDNISVKGHNIFVEEIAKIVNKDTPTSDSEKTEDNTKVVKKLDELILLMRRGGIQVNVDGRKVSKAVATAQDQ